MSKFAEWAEVNEYWPRERSIDEQELIDKIVSTRFIDLMINRMLVSHYKYGDSQSGFPEKIAAIDNVRIRLQKYEETKNVEYLIDAANFCMLEFMHPSIKEAFFKATDSEGSPGILYRDGKFSSGKHQEKENNNA